MNKSLLKIKNIDKQTKITICSLVLMVLLFAGGVKFIGEKIIKDPSLLTAQINLENKLKDFSEMRPVKGREAPDLEIKAKSVLSVLVYNNGEEKKLFEKDSEEILPFASLAKLMTAWVALEHYDLSKEIVVSEKTAKQQGNFGKLEQGKTFPTEYLLYPLLMESSNAAAFALANDYDEITEERFLELMNQEAKKIELENTFFSNSTGLDPQEIKTEKINHSTAADLVKFTKKLMEKPLIWEILSLPRYSLYGPELINTNKFLLNNDASWQDKIIGGKTGYTNKAGGCLLLVVEAPKEKGYLINVILGSDGVENRFEEMRKLVDWLKTAYVW